MSFLGSGADSRQNTLQQFVCCNLHIRCHGNALSSVATGTYSPKPRPADGHIAAFRRHVTILYASTKISYYSPCIKVITLKSSPNKICLWLVLRWYVACIDYRLQRLHSAELEDGWWRGNDLEGSNRGLTEVSSRYLTGESEEKYQETGKPTVLQAETRTRCLPNTILERCCYAKFWVHI
jgi:hypothetical protein